MKSTPADLRAARARQQVSIYTLAAHVRLHPGRLGRMLNEKVPMPRAVARRIEAALRELEPA